MISSCKNVFGLLKNNIGFSQTIDSAAAEFLSVLICDIHKLTRSTYTIPYTEFELIFFIQSTIAC